MGFLFLYGNILLEAKITTISKMTTQSDNNTNDKVFVVLKDIVFLCQINQSKPNDGFGLGSLVIKWQKLALLRADNAPKAVLRQTAPPLDWQPSLPI